MQIVKFPSGLHGILLLWSRDFYLGRHFEKNVGLQVCCISGILLGNPQSQFSSGQSEATVVLVLLDLPVPPKLQ